MVEEVGLARVCTERTVNSAISHNKFMVKLEDDNPIEVWTGGTNFSDGGIFGHSNVAHVIEDAGIAAKFLEYWTVLQQDPEFATIRPKNVQISPDLPTTPPPGVSVLFSPRTSLNVLNWYANLAKSSTEGLFMTFAFGMNEVFQDAYRTGQAPVRFALMEKKTRPMQAGPARDAEEEKIQLLRNMPENVFAIGSLIPTNEIDGWVAERLTGLNTNVRYVHNKFMLVDPLSDDPIVVAGSANFSAASTTDNDENMIVTRGSKRAADIYLGEFMRLFTHHAFRESLPWRNADEPPKPLSIGAWWQDSFGQTPRSSRRKYFARVAV
jgi:hypothetical protein